jgi:serine/threonine-protein kinase
MSPEPANPSSQCIARLGKYEVLSLVATGGMGAVYKARDVEAGREVALKILMPEMAAKPAMLERFKREARAAAKLRHENIVTLYEFDEAAGTWFLAMEFVDGIDLAEYAARKGKLDPDEATSLMMQACRALRHAHKQGLVHRDIKPSNFLVTRKDGRLILKLTDLGLARETGGDEFRVTRAGTTVGTVDYMAPEQARDSGRADVRSDLYALGCTWFHLLAGQPPFPEGGLTERLYKHAEAEPPDLRALNPQVSEAAAGVIRRLLAKKPEDRYQTPSDLLRELKTLQARTRPALPRAVDVARIPTPAEVPSPQRKTDPPVVPSSGTVKRPPSVPARPLSKPGRSSGEARQMKTAPRPARRTGKRGWFFAAGAVALVAAGAIGAALALRGPKPEDRKTENAPQPRVERRPVIPAEPVLDERSSQLETNPGPVKPRWPRLYHSFNALDVASLRQEVEKPWTEGKPVVPDGPVLPVVRVPGVGVDRTFSTLAAAVAAAPAGVTTVIEIRDNGPLYEGPIATAGRSLIVRAGKGYRPLLAWDTRRGWGASEPGTRAFLSTAGGNLTLDGIDLIMKWPEGSGGSSAWLQVTDGHLTVSDCTFSLAGKPASGVTLARMRGERSDGCRCRLTRCFARGNGLAALDLDAAWMDVLIDGCLLVGGEPALMQVSCGKDRPADLRVVRSTLVAGKTLLRVRSHSAADATPTLHWLGWDALLGRSAGPDGAEMVTLTEGASARALTWRAINCLYAGWPTLLAGPELLASSDLEVWRRRWGMVEGEAVARDPWPAATFAELAEIPAVTYNPAGTPVAFAASVAPEEPLGCNLAALPPSRDNWLSLTYDLFPVAPPEALASNEAPEIPDPGDGRYHGERLDLNTVDLGAYLTTVQRRRQLGPRVVLHLTGSGERPVTPFRFKGASLVLYFEPPSEDAAPLVLSLSGRERVNQEALIEVDGGGLDVINGELRFPDFRLALVPPYFFQVRGGDLRLFGCRLLGPQHQVPAAFRGLVRVEGSGDEGPERARGCAINQSVLVSGKASVILAGIGNHLLLRQCVVVAGTDAVDVEPGPHFKGRANVECRLEQTTVAARRAVVHLDDVKNPVPLAEPVVVQTRESAFLNPFPPPSNRAGLFHFGGEALAHGLLVWQGEGNGFDKNLHFGAAGTIPEKNEDLTGWMRLWGPQGERRPIAEILTGRAFEAERWPLDRLAVRLRDGSKAPGADLALIGILKKKSGK